MLRQLTLFLLTLVRGRRIPGSSCQTVFFDDPVGPLTSPGLLLDPSYPVYTDDTLFQYAQVLNVSK
jgi:hypothetical protein